MRVLTFLPLCKKEFYEQYCTYRLFIAVVIFLLMGISSPVLTKLTPDMLKSLGGGVQIILPPQTATDALNSYVKNMTQIPPLALILLAMGCIADERSRGTAVTVLTKPVSRSTFVLAKFLAYEVTLLFSLILAGAGAYFYTAQLFDALPVGGFLLLNLDLFIFLSLSLAMSVCASALFRNSVAAGGLAFGGFLVLSLLPALNSTIAQALPSMLFSAGRVVQLLAGTIALGDILRPMLIGVTLILALIVLACVIFQQEEI